MLAWLSSYSSIWLTLHLFAMVLGLGGATYSDILLVSFLKDLKISKKEAGVIHTMSQVILVGIVLATISGFFLFWPNQELLLESPKFLTKLIVFSILVINGFLLHHMVMPKLVHFSFHKNHYLLRQTIHLRHLGFAMGAISLVSWYAVFLLGSFKNVPFSLTTLLLMYFGALFVAISAALILERQMSSRISS